MVDPAISGVISVWHPLTRLFHWSLAVSFAVAWLTADEWDKVHNWAGYAIVGLAVFRAAWGIAGPRYARFPQFVRSPSTVLRYLGHVMLGTETRYIGHNPAGGSMVVALLVVLLLTSLTGWMYTLDAFWGVEWVEDTHEFLANAMLVMVAIHLSGVALASFRHRENLVLSMITGRKRVPSSTDIV